MHNDVEEWRATHHPNYEVSNLGRVRSWAKPGSNYGARVDVPRLLRPGIASNGYPSVVLGTGNTCFIHHLVTAAFLGPCPEGLEVMHTDDNRRNNLLGNLAYGTHKDNMRQKAIHGRAAMSLSPEEVSVIRGLGDGFTKSELSRRFNVSRTTIRAVLSRRTWTHVA